MISLLSICIRGQIKHSITYTYLYLIRTKYTSVHIVLTDNFKGSSRSALHIVELPIIFLHIHVLYLLLLLYHHLLNSYLSLLFDELYRSGYASAAKHFKTDDIPADISGRVFMITGANSGLGKATALALAHKGTSTV